MGNFVFLRSGNKAVAHGGSATCGHGFGNREFCFSLRRKQDRQSPLFSLFREKIIQSTARSEQRKERARSRRGKICAKIHRKIANQRKNFCHKKSREIARKYQTICVEGLEIKNKDLTTQKAKADASCKSVSTISNMQSGGSLTRGMEFVTQRKNTAIAAR